MVTLDALTFKNFANAHAGSPSGFGGPVTGFNPGGGDNGGVEALPHNRIHTRIGGDTGFMSRPGHRGARSDLLAAPLPTSTGCGRCGATRGRNICNSDRSALADRRDLPGA